MKRICLFLIAVIIMTGASLKAQTPAPTATSVLNYPVLESKLKKSDADIQNEKKNTKAKTWTTRAEVLIDIYNVHNGILAKGMDPASIKLLFMKDPTEIKTTQEGPNKVEIYVYDRVDLKFVNGGLASWTEKNKIHADPLTEAQKSLDEAIKLNTDTKANDDILKVIDVLKTSYQNEAVIAYENLEYKASHQYFVNMLDLNKIPLMNNKIDTIIIFYAGRAAFEDKDYTEASKLFEETASYNYKEPLLYVFRKQSLFGIGDTAKGVEVMQQGFNAFPENQSIMIEMINYYLEADKAEEALTLIQKAKSGDPENVSYIFTEGTLYDKLGRVAEAEKSYKECIAKKPDYYDAHYNLGVLYYNNAVIIYEAASKISDNTEFEKKQAEGDETLKLAVSPMETIAKLEVTDPRGIETKRSALETLKTIYYRLKMEDKRQGVINQLNAL